MGPIELQLRNYRCFSDGKPVVLELRDGFTALLGPNNVGKSSLLRFLFEFRDLFNRTKPQSELVSAIRSQLSFSYPPSVVDPNEVFCNANSRDLEIRLRIVEPSNAGAPPSADELLLTVPRGSNTVRAEVRIGGTPIALNGVSNGVIAINEAGSPIANLADIADALRSLTDALYVGPFRNAINVGSDESYYDIRTGQAFIKEWRRLKTGAVKKQKEAAYQLTESIKSLFSFAALEINASVDEQTLDIFIDGRSYRLSELGAGLTQFILTLANAATRDPRPSFILIDEPETSLHPTLQLDFLTTLAAYASNGVAFATHVVGLARSSADTIYTVTRTRSNDSSRLALYERTTALAELLGELSFSGYQVLGFDRVLVVEGITDVKTLQQFLRLYKKEHQILIVPGGGSELFSKAYQDQLLEVKARVAKKLTVLIDSEKKGPTANLVTKRDRFANDCKTNGVDSHILDRRAIENYFTQRAIDTALGPGYFALGPFEKLASAARPWAKIENWRVARAMRRADLAKTDLGAFLSRL